MKKHLLIQALILIIVLMGVLWMRHYDGIIVSSDNKSDEIIDLYDRLASELYGKSNDSLINTSANNVNLIQSIKDSSSIYKRIMIVRFSDINCNSCRSIDMPILSLVNRDSIYVIYASSYSNEDDVNFFKRINQLDGEIFRIDTPLLSIDSELINANYYLLLNDKLMIREFFVASPYFPDRTKEWII